MPEFGRLLVVRLFSQFGDGIFQASLAGAILFNPERAANPWSIAGAFAVLFLPYSLLGPFAGALLDRWDRRLVLVGANLTRLLLIAGVGVLLALGAGNVTVLCGALIVNGSTRFVMSGLSAALPHVVPREQVVTMNSVATALGAVATFVGANSMLIPRLAFGAGDRGSAAVIFTVTIPVLFALVLALRFPKRSLGPDDTTRAIHGSAFYAVATGWLHGLRTVAATPSVAATLTSLAAHRMVFGINTLLMLVFVRHISGASIALVGMGTAVGFAASTGTGSFLANLLTPVVVRRLGRFATANWALVIAAVVQVIAASLLLPVLLVCGFFLGIAGQVIKLCADTAMQMDVDDPLRGHVFAVQDSLFWLTFLVMITAAAAVIPADGRSPLLLLTGAAIYLAGLAVHSVVGRRGPPGAIG